MDTLAELEKERDAIETIFDSDDYKKMLIKDVITLNERYRKICDDIKTMKEV